MHKQLTLEQRYYIYIARKKGQSMRRIATELGIAHSTVGRELKRNTGKRGYRHRQANTLAQQRHAVKHKSIKMNQAVKRLIKNRLAFFVGVHDFSFMISLLLWVSMIFQFFGNTSPLCRVEKPRCPLSEGI